MVTHAAAGARIRSSNMSEGQIMIAAGASSGHSSGDTSLDKGIVAAATAAVTAAATAGSSCSNRSSSSTEMHKSNYLIKFGQNFPNFSQITIIYIYYLVFRIRLGGAVDNIYIYTSSPFGPG